MRVWAPVATESVRDPVSAAAASVLATAFPSIESTERVLLTTGSADHTKQSVLAIFRSLAVLSARSSSSLPRFTACLVLPFLAPTICGRLRLRSPPPRSSSSIAPIAAR